LSAGQEKRLALQKAAESGEPLVSIGTLVKTCMPLVILTGLLACGARGRAILDHKDLVNDD
jgi:hypothetical protein